MNRRDLKSLRYPADQSFTKPHTSPLVSSLSYRTRLGVLYRLQYRTSSGSVCGVVFASRFRAVQVPPSVDHAFFPHPEQPSVRRFREKMCHASCGLYHQPACYPLLAPVSIFAPPVYCPSFGNNRRGYWFWSATPNSIEEWGPTLMCFS